MLHRTVQLLGSRAKPGQVTCQYIIFYKCESVIVRCVGQIRLFDWPKRKTVDWLKSFLSQRIKIRFREICFLLNTFFANLKIRFEARRLLSPNESSELTRCALKRMATDSERHGD